MLLLFTYELQRRLRLAGAPVEAFAVHPGELQAASGAGDQTGRSVNPIHPEQAVACEH